MNKVIAIDGNSILNRAFYGVKPLTNKNGQQTGAIFGMLNIIFAQVEKINPDGVVVAFDLKAPTFRHLMYDKYKSNRHGMPEELASQLPYAKKILTALGYNVIVKEGYEADDILGTVAKISENEGAAVYLLSGDRDLLQLISGNTTMLLAGNSETKAFGKNEFFEKYGIMPESFVDLKALMGDSSDCIPGVPGIGEKTALKLMTKYGSLDRIYGGLEEMEKDTAVRKKLEAGKESAYISKKLAEIFREVPLEMTSEDFSLKPCDKEALLQVFTELEFSSFIKKFKLDEVKAENSYYGAEETAVGITPQELLSMKGEFWGSITTSGAYLTDGEKSFECPYKGIEEIAGFFTRERKLTVFDSKKLYHLLLNIGIDDFIADFDIMLGVYALNPALSETVFENVSLSYLGRQESEKNSMAVKSLAAIIKERIKNENLEKVYYELELPLAHVLAKMEHRGFKVEREGLEEYSLVLEKSIEGLREQIYFYALGEFNVNSPKQLGEVLFDKLGLPAQKKTKSGYSTDAEVLEKLRPYHPIVDTVLEYRKLAKLRATYAEGLLKVADGDGMVHTDFKQTGTVTGRLSSAEPNLQNIPVRSEEGRMLRKFFVPRDGGRVLIDADYSQIELRILAHLSGDENMIKAFADGGDIHTLTASQVFGVSPEDVTPELRKRAKAINFGIIYGMSDFTLASDLGITKWQASSYIKNYFATYPKIESYLKGSVEYGVENGYTLTLFGRKRYIPELQAGKARLRAFGERVAMNSPIQGSAADIIKLAMINTEKALLDARLDAILILQVHDELIIDASLEHSEEAARILKREMENAAKLSVDLTVDLNIGSTWYDCK